MKRNYVYAIITLLILLFLGISMGNEWINIFKVDSNELNILYYLRGPRVIFSVLTGMGLGLCGTSMQVITRNPMASPFTLGVSSAAAFGAALSIVIFGERELYIILGAFSATMICALIIYFLSLRNKIESITIIIIGIALNYFFAALTSTLQYIASEEKLSSIVKWTFGSFNGVEWSNVYVVFIFLVLVFIVFQKKAWRLNLICNCDDDYAITLGVNVGRERLVIGLLSLVLTASIISMSGIIGFVGLVAPYISKKIVGENHKYLLSYSMLMGGILVILSDTIGRTLFSPLIIPIGIIMSYVGVPILIHLILKKGEEN
ncbi:FecCD family ABC transporter permease [Psychrilyobacter atlanticus]|uniref:FecCD family ABC transporter permease n=1 Tax=Psychrilyobacter atlanticus TaxID=271091 RepID=UPI0003FFB6DB|nr:iron ABC transporter permease [Psychrilyobacter atlanticus]